MSTKKTTPERLVTFSDGVFAVIITIMVLDLKRPAESTLKALLPLWPTALSYAISYLFVAIIWVNHHHLLRFAHEATPQLIWWNFAHLFMVSLVPATTVWMAATKLAAAPVFVYALVFVLVETAYIAFERAALSQASDRDITPRLLRIARIRSYLALGMFSAATAVSYWSPMSGLALVCCVLLIYLSPRIPDFLHKSVRSKPICTTSQEWRNIMKNSVAIVTGASQGIGRSTAIRLARDFSAVVLAARNAKELAEVATEVQKMGTEPLPLALDLSRPRALNSLHLATVHTDRCTRHPFRGRRDHES